MVVSGNKPEMIVWPECKMRLFVLRHIYTSSRQLQYDVLQYD